MEVTSFLYLQLDLLCIAILLILFFNLRMSGDNRSQQIYLARALIGSSIMILFDAIWSLDGYGLVNMPLTLNYIVNICYFAADAMMCFFWTHYSEHIQQSRIITSRRWHLHMFMPPVMVTILATISPWTGWVFTLGENGEYIRGPLFALFMFLCYGVPIFSLCKSLILSFHKKYESRKYELRIMSSFVIYPMIAGVLQLLIPGTPCLCVGITLAAVTVFIFMQNRLISLDPLTGLNNRYQLRAFMSRKLSDYKADSKGNMYMMLLDVDNFKAVNDTYGHVEGDRVLELVAAAMKRACQSSPAFISRLGGDEFVILCEFDSADHATALCDAINELLHESSKQLPFELHACYGVAAYPGNNVTAQQFLALADAELYKAKRSKKQNIL